MYVNGARTITVANLEEVIWTGEKRDCDRRSLLQSHRLVFLELWMYSGKIESGRELFIREKDSLDRLLSIAELIEEEEEEEEEEENGERKGVE